MNLGQARSLSLVFALMSCSTDTLVVATLDASGGEGGAAGAPNGGGRGGEPGAANGGTPGADEPGGMGGEEGGGAGTARGGGGTNTGGTSGTGGTGGTGLVTELEGEPTTSVCACVGSTSFVCGADGITYDPGCTSGCDQVVIACLHACPCEDAPGAGGAPNSTEWIDERCFDSSLCPSGSLCFSSDGTTPSTPCDP